MQQTALILPYFGTLPNYFELWLLSAGTNEMITFLIFSDCDFSKYKMPKNVHVVQMTFEQVKERVAKVLDFKFTLHMPYKLCDYRPLYGLLFADYLKDYAFWGHCDPDIIWGNLSHFVPENLLQKYDRLYRRGHLCIYRNTQAINEAALQQPSNSCISYKDVYTHRYSAHFDEGELIEHLVKQAGGVVWDSVDFADVSYFHKQFVLIKNDTEQESVAAFRWKNGKLVGLAVNGYEKVEQEYVYVHLQKRKMAYNTQLNKNDFLIAPNEFLSFTDNWTDYEMQWLKPDEVFERTAQYNNRLNQLKNIKEGALWFRMKGLLDRMMNKS